jgi:hypothetical protein
MKEKVKCQYLGPPGLQRSPFVNHFHFRPLFLGIPIRGDRRLRVGSNSFRSLHQGIPIRESLEPRACCSFCFRSLHQGIPIRESFSLVCCFRCVSVPCIRESPSGQNTPCRSSTSVSVPCIRESPSGRRTDSPKRCLVSVPCIRESPSGPDFSFSSFLVSFRSLHQGIPIRGLSY